MSSVERGDDVARKKINYLELSYPLFALGQIIDPEEANQNNYDITTKINEFVDEVEEALDIADNSYDKSNEAIGLANDAINIAETKGDQAISTSNDAVDLANQAIGISNNADEKANQAINTSNQAIGIANNAEGVANGTRYDLDIAMMELQSAINRAEQAVIDAQSAVGNTQIIYDVYTVISADNEDGTFTYTNGVDNFIGEITPEGYQRFTLTDEYYVGSNRIEATINDALTRSEASGGLKEIGNIDELSSTVDLTITVGDGTEVTFKYYKQISLGGRHAMSHNVWGNDALITLSSEEPETMYAGQIMFKEV